MSGDPQDRRAAEELLAQAKQHPRKVLERGARFLAVVRDRSDHAAEAIVLRALGDAARFAATLPESIAYLEQSVAAAQSAGDAALVRDARLTLAGSQAITGDTVAALATLRRAAAGADDVMQARIGFQRGATLARAGRPREALVEFGRALPVFRRVDDRYFIAMTLHNRGTVHAYAGAFPAAESDLNEAAALCTQLGLASIAAGIEHNLGLVAGYRGDIPDALHHFDRSEEQLRDLTGTPWEVQVSRCEVLLSAGLYDDALLLAGDIRARMRNAGMGADEAEANLVLAQAALHAGDLAVAREAAATAETLLLTQDRPGWLAHAQLATLLAQADAAPSGESADHARRVARALEEAGQFIPAANARLLAGRLSLGLGDLAAARRDLDPLVPYRWRGPVELRLSAWEAAAFSRLAAGNTRGADAAARAGLRTIERHQAALGATDVRVGVSRHAAELAALGLRLAAASGTARRVWDWMERTRAGALRLAPRRPSADRGMADDVARLRQVNYSLRSASPDEAARLRRRQASLQQEIRRRSHVAKGGTSPAPRKRLDPGNVAAQIGSGHLVEYGDVDGALVAVVVDPRGVRMTRLGGVSEAAEMIGRLRVVMTRAARGNVDRGEPALIADYARRLDGMLLEPLDLGDGPLVVIPPARFLTLPWALLPSRRGRPTTIAPSAEMWLAAARRRTRRRTGVVLAAGPDLGFAAAELRALGTVYPQARRMTGRTATVAAMLSALAESRVAHIVCHGSFRRDNPLFSSLQMADGDLTVWDVEGIRRVPETIVLSACDSGAAHASPGNELIGLSGAMLALGARNLIVSVGLVPDRPATPRFMADLHRRLAAGAAPAAALAASQAPLEERVPVASSFVCLGAG